MKDNSLPPKFCGQTTLPLLSKVKIIKNTHGDKDDDNLIGLTGEATHPFAFGETKKGWIGVRLDESSPKGSGMPSRFGGSESINIHISEVEIISE